MRLHITLIVIILFVLASCETPIDAGNETMSDDEPAVPHVEEVVKDESPPAAPEPAPAPPPAPAPEPAPAPAAPEPAPVPPPAPAAPDPVAVAPSTEVGPSDKPAASLTASLSEEAKSLLARADEKVKSYDFVYAPPPDNLARDRYYIKGTKMKAELYDRGWFNPETHMTSVYVDASTKTAVGYCEDNRLTHCPDPERKFPLAYETYAIKTPYQWLKEIQYGRLEEGEKLNERMTKKISYSKEGVVYEQWIDTYSGLPMRVRITDSKGQSIFDFRHVNVNSVTDSVFIHSAT